MSRELDDTHIEFPSGVYGKLIRTFWAKTAWLQALHASILLTGAPIYISKLFSVDCGLTLAEFAFLYIDYYYYSL